MEAKKAADCCQKGLQSAMKQQRTKTGKEQECVSLLRIQLFETRPDSECEESKTEKREEPRKSNK